MHITKRPSAHDYLSHDFPTTEEECLLKREDHWRKDMERNEFFQSIRVSEKGQKYILTHKNANPSRLSISSSFEARDKALLRDHPEGSLGLNRGPRVRLIRWIVLLPSRTREYEI